MANTTCASAATIAACIATLLPAQTPPATLHSPVCSLRLCRCERSGRARERHRLRAGRFAARPAAIHHHRFDAGQELSARQRFRRLRPGRLAHSSTRSRSTTACAGSSSRPTPRNTITWPTLPPIQRMALPRRPSSKRDPQVFPTVWSIRGARHLLRASVLHGAFPRSSRWWSAADSA